jgi:hypothetical protein
VTNRSVASFAAGHKEGVMRRRTRVLVTISGVVAAGLVATGVVSGQAASARTGHTASARTGHVLVAREKFTKTLVEHLGEKGAAFGDRFLFTSEVRDLKGGMLGIGVGDCFRLSGTSDSDGQYNCVQTYHLAGGDFVSSGFFDFAEKTNRWAVTGGTGRYRGVTGEADFTSLAADTFADTFSFR